MSILRSTFVLFMIVAATPVLAKRSYVEGTIIAVDRAEKTVSVELDNSGEAKTYAYAASARVDMGSNVRKRVHELRAGDTVILELKSVAKEASAN